MGLRCVYVTCNISAQVTRTSAGQVERGWRRGRGDGDRYSDTFSTQVTHKANKSAMLQPSSATWRYSVSSTGKGKEKEKKEYKRGKREKGRNTKLKQTNRQSILKLLSLKIPCNCVHHLHCKDWDTAVKRKRARQIDKERKIESCTVNSLCSHFCN